MHPDLWQMQVLNGKNPNNEVVELAVFAKDAYVDLGAAVNVRVALASKDCSISSEWHSAWLTSRSNSTRTRLLLLLPLPWAHPSLPGHLYPDGNVQHTAADRCPLSPLAPSPAGNTRVLRWSLR